MRCSTKFSTQNTAVSSRYSNSTANSTVLIVQLIVQYSSNNTILVLKYFKKVLERKYGIAVIVPLILLEVPVVALLNLGLHVHVQASTCR